MKARVFWNNAIQLAIHFLKKIIYVSFIQKQKTLNLGPKIPYLGIFGLQFNKNYSQISNQYSRNCETTKFHPKKNKNKLRTKNTLLSLWAGKFKNYCHICNQRPPIFLTAKFLAKIRILKFGTKNVLFVEFWIRICNQRPPIGLTAKFCAKIRILNFGTENALLENVSLYFKTMPSYLKSAQHSQICLIAKFCEKNENSEICDQKCFIWVFWG